MLDTRPANKASDLPWPECFYMETGGEARGRLLEDQLKEDPSRENQLRKLLWEKRYVNEKGKVTGVDFFMKAWGQGDFLRRQKGSLFGKKAYQKGIAEVCEIFGFKELKENPDYKKLWYDEYVNFISFYIEISRTDSTYSSVLFNIGKISDKGMAVKLADDLVEKSVRLPKELGLEEEFTLIKEAARSCYEYYFGGEVEYFDLLVSKA